MQSNLLANFCQTFLIFTKWQEMTQSLLSGKKTPDSNSFIQILNPFLELPFHVKHYSNKITSKDMVIFTFILQSVMVVRHICQMLECIFLVCSLCLSNADLHLETLMLIWMTLRLTFGLLKSWWEALVKLFRFWQAPRAKIIKCVLNFPQSVMRIKVLWINSHMAYRYAVVYGCQAHNHNH